MLTAVRIMLTKFVATVDRELFGEDVSQLFPRQGMTTRQQWEQLPVKRRGVTWDEDGRMFVHEFRQCPQTGLKVRLVREIDGSDLG